MCNELEIIIAAIVVAAYNQTLVTKDTDFLTLKSDKITVITNY
ncbi:MAG: hypothetical protein ACQCN4_12460 [Candidatus Bathyarchaeia archaeon]